jgi:hypothetical protein
MTLDPPESGRVYVVECSSYQIDLAPSINPTAGILLNLTPDHLDRHGTMPHYAAIKERLVAWARAWPQGAHDEPWRALATLPERWVAPVFPLKAADFIKRGVSQGPALGEALRAAEKAWIAADFPGDAAALAAIADRAAASSETPRPCTKPRDCRGAAVLASWIPGGELATNGCVIQNAYFAARANPSAPKQEPRHRCQGSGIRSRRRHCAIGRNR